MVKAKYADVVTSDCKIIYSDELPAINSVKLGINGKSADNDITGVFTSCSSPVMYLVTGKAFTFAADISNSENVERVFITSTKDDKVAKIEAKFNKESGLWIAEGYFDGYNNYVPGDLNIVIVSKSENSALKDSKGSIDYTKGFYSRPGNIRFAVDPSGIVYEGAPSNAVKGAEMTVYYLNDEGKAVVWDGTDYDQKNPLITDEFGAYAWDVVTSGTRAYDIAVRIKTAGYDPAKIVVRPNLDKAVEELASTEGRKFVIANYTAVQPTRSALKRYISKHGGNK